MPGRDSMHAVYLRGYGGLDQLDYTDQAPIPQPGPGEVLVRVGAAGINNTDINTRTGWYHTGVQRGTDAAGGARGFGVEQGGMGDWSGDICFPRIQGADVAGRIAFTGEAVDSGLADRRVICDPYWRQSGNPDDLDGATFLGADHDGGFAEYLRMPARNAIALPEDLPLSDAALATLPCSGGTAMNMLLLAGVGPGDRMLVTGASGGVGSFLLQIGRQLGAEVVGVAAAGKIERLGEIGAHAVIERETEDFVAAATDAGGGGAYSVVADVVGGERFVDCLALLGRGGRYVTAGAIAGAQVPLDLRTLYLKNLAFFGSTVFLAQTMPRLVELALAGELEPAVERSYPLGEIREAQTHFLEKTHVGSLVLIPPAS